MSALPPQGFSNSSAVISMARQIGTVLGVALLVAVPGATHTLAESVRIFGHAWWLPSAQARRPLWPALSIGQPAKCATQ